MNHYQNSQGGAEDWDVDEAAPFNWPEYINEQILKMKNLIQKLINKWIDYNRTK